jgi:hypothetical protein
MLSASDRELAIAVCGHGDRRKLVKRMMKLGVALAALALPGVASAGAPSGPHQFCQVQFVSGGPLYSGVGVSVQSAAGATMTVCHVHVTPPADTVVQTFPGSRGDVVVITRSGAAVVVFRTR